MIRFRCLHCSKTLKVSEGRAGAVIVCPRCKERSTIPGDAYARWTGPEGESSPPEGAGRLDAPHIDPAPPLLARMGRRTRWAVGLVVAAAVLSVVLAIVAPRVHALADIVDSTTYGVTPFLFCCAIILLVMLYGHGAGCPSCGRWWARTKVETEFVDREVIKKEGVPFARSTYRTIYECRSCKHRWSATITDEYKDFIRHRDRPRQQLS
jgi:hypothetical protein